MRDVEHDNGVGLLLDPVTDAPVLPAARGVLACVFVAKRMPDTVRIVKEGPTIELGGCGGDLFGQPRELALSARPDVELPATPSIGHAAPVLRNR